MGSKKTKTTSKETAVTTPNTPDYISGPVQNYYGAVSGFAGADPYSFATPANALQNQAFGNATNLSTSPLYGQAAGAVQGIMGRATPTAAFGTASLGSLGNAAQASAQGYTAPSLGNASQAGFSGYTAPSLGEAAQAGPINLSKDVERMQAASLLDGFDRYHNPATQRLVDTTLSSFDSNADKSRAAMAAQAARSGAFGGSRYGLAQAETEQNLARERALTEAGLRSNAWNAAAGLASTDAGFRQQAGMANTAAANNRAETLAGLEAQNSQFNTRERNQYGLAGAAMQADAARHFADAGNRASEVNAGFNNQFALTGAGLQADAARFGADARNAASLANAGFNNQFDLARFGAENDLSRFNTNAYNVNQQFNADQQLAAQQQQLQGAGMLGDLAGSMSDDERANMLAQLEAGGQLWDIENAYRRAPITHLATVGDLLDPTLIDQVTGQTIQSDGTSTSKTKGGLLGSILSAGAQLGGAAIMASERRVKRDIERIGRMPDGLGVYRFNYVWDAPGTPKQTGVMVDEVETLRPWALGPVQNGIRTVDYSKLEAA